MPRHIYPQDHVVPPHVAMPNADVANLSIQDLQHKLKECWVRYEKAVKQEMAPLLYHLRKLLRKQGSRTDLTKHGSYVGEGFAQWVKVNLGLSLSTVNRWANEYAGLKKRTSGQMNRSKPPSPPDGQYSLNFIFTRAQREELDWAQKILGDERIQQVMFDAAIKAAKAQEMDQVAAAAHPTKKAPARASSTKRTKEVIQ